MSACLSVCLKLKIINWALPDWALHFREYATGPMMVLSYFIVGLGHPSKKNFDFFYKINI